jgi:hypothetical protein
MPDHTTPGGAPGPRDRDAAVAEPAVVEPVATQPAGRPAGRPVWRRRRSRFWLLLFPLLLLPLLMRDGDRADVDGRTGDASVTTSTAGGEVVAGGAVDRFAEWANRGGDAAVPAESEDTHPYTTEGIRLLADALGEAGGTADRVSAIRIRGDQLGRAAGGGDRHAEYAHAAFVDAARLIGELRGGADPLLSAANAVRPGRPLGPQSAEVRAFFRQAAAALQGRG